MRSAIEVGGGDLNHQAHRRLRDRPSPRQHHEDHERQCHDRPGDEGDHDQISPPGGQPHRWCSRPHPESDLVTHERALNHATCAKRSTRPTPSTMMGVTHFLSDLWCPWLPSSPFDVEATRESQSLQGAITVPANRHRRFIFGDSTASGMATTKTARIGIARRRCRERQGQRRAVRQRLWSTRR